MALHWYKDAACTDRISEGGTMSNPDRHLETSAAGADHQYPLWLKNDDSARSYSEVWVSCLNADAAVYWQYALDVAGEPGAWLEVLPLDDILDAVTPVKIWCRERCIVGLPTQRRKLMRHHVEFVEAA
jgi:hypothetical protein